MNKEHTPKYVDISCVERCVHHQRNVIFYFCEKHDDIGCYECMSTNHSTCATQSIDKIADGTKDCREYTTLLDDLTGLIVQAKENEKKAIENKLNSDICLAMTMRDIRAFRHDIDAHLDRMELDITTEAKQQHSEYQSAINERIEESKTIQENVEKVIKEMKEAESKDTRLFIKMKQKRTDFAKYKHDTQRDKAQRTQSISFEPNPCVSSVFRTSNSLGKLQIDIVNEGGEGKFKKDEPETVTERIKDSNFDHEDIDITQEQNGEREALEMVDSVSENTEGKAKKGYKVCDALNQEQDCQRDPNMDDIVQSKENKQTKTVDQQDMKMRAAGRISAKLFTDKEDCDISGIDLLSENKIVLADYNNRSIKVFDLNEDRISDEIKLEFHPYDLTVPTTNTVAVTLTNTIQMITKAHLLFLGDTIKVDGECYGIASSRTKLFVSFMKPVPKVEIITHEGDVLQKIKMDASKGLQRLRYIAVSPDEKFIYLTDFKTDKIVRIDSKGEQTIVFSDLKILNGPYGIHVDSQGRVFVCNYGNDEIFEFSADFSNHKMVLSKTEGIESPQAIYMYGKQNKLFIACTDSADCNEVQIFSHGSK